MSRVTSLASELLKIKQPCGRALGTPGLATAQIGPILRGPQFPGFEGMQALLKFPFLPAIPRPAAAAGGLLCFPAQLLRPGFPGLCPVLFWLLDLLQTGSWQRSPRAQPKLPLSLGSWPLQYGQKRWAGANWHKSLKSQRMILRRAAGRSARRTPPSAELFH